MQKFHPIQRKLLAEAARTLIFSACLALFFTADRSYAQSDAAGSSPPAPLFDGLGNHHHPISTTSKQAQRYFDQGLTLAYGFNHAEAIRSFRAAAALDPECAMAYWGIALALGPNINAPMSPEALPPALEALARAMELKDAATEAERDYIEALRFRYDETWTDDRSELDRAYANAMRAVHEKHPGDADAAVLFAEALMDVMPWDYWNEDLTPKPETKEVLKALRGVIARHPEHPGAHHLLIHAVEAGPDPSEGLASADRLGGLVPASGHLTHMPSHIYLRVGKYPQATEANILASKVDEQYIASCRSQGFYPGVYYPHNVQFLCYSASMEGRSAMSLRAAEDVAKFALDNVCGPAQVIEAPRFRHLPILIMARFGQWEAVLKEPRVPGGSLFDDAMRHYARGLAYLGLGKKDEAREAHRLFLKLKNDPGMAELDSPYFPGTQMLEVSARLFAGKIAEANGDVDAALGEMDRAIAAQKALPYMEPPYWYYPAWQSKAALLFRAGRYAEAEKTFREDLEHYPDNGWSYHGLHRCLERQGKPSEAGRARQSFLRAWKNADVQPDLSWY